MKLQRTRSLFTLTKTILQRFFSFNDPSMKVIFVQVLLKNDQQTAAPESATSSWRVSVFCCSGEPMAADGWDKTAALKFASPDPS